MDQYLTAGKSFNLTLPVSVRNLTFSLVVKYADIETKQTYYKLGYPSATLYMQKVRQPGEPWYDPKSPEFRANHFSIYEGNLYEIRQLFQEAAAWFSPEGIELIYGKNDDGEWVRNSEYNNLYVQYISEFANVKGGIRVLPTLLQTGQGKFEPGAVLCMNNSDNVIDLYPNEVIRISNFLNDFNFISYTNFVFNTFKVAQETGRVMSEEETAARYNQYRQYDPNVI